MRILHLTPYYKPAYAFGGVPRAVEGMATSLAKRGHQVTVLTTDALNHSERIPSERDAIIDGLRVLRRPNVSTSMRGRLNLSSPRSMKKTAASLLPNVDILHLHEFRTVENLLVTPLAQSLGIPTALSAHGTINRGTGRRRFKSLWDRLLSPAIAQRIAHIIALTESELAEIHSVWSQFGKRESPAQFSVIPNGIHPDAFKKLPGGEAFRRRYGLEDAPTVLFLGRLHARKGVDVLARAFRQTGVEDARLVIAGPDEGMLSVVQTLAEDDIRIVCPGYLNSEERLGALAACDIFALPAIGEGLSMSVLEAMAAGLPLLISPGCNMPQVETAGAGFVTEASAEAFADKLGLLLADDALRARMGEAGKRLAAENYAWRNIALMLEQVYESMLSFR